MFLSLHCMFCVYRSAVCEIRRLWFQSSWRRLRRSVRSTWSWSAIGCCLVTRYARRSLLRTARQGSQRSVDSSARANTGMKISTKSSPSSPTAGNASAYYCHYHDRRWIQFRSNYKIIENVNLDKMFGSVFFAFGDRENFYRPDTSYNVAQRIASKHKPLCITAMYFYPEYSVPEGRQIVKKTNLIITIIINNNKNCCFCYCYYFLTQGKEPGSL